MANKSNDIYHKKFIVMVKCMDDPAKEEAVKPVYLALLMRFLPLREHWGWMETTSKTPQFDVAETAFLTHGNNNILSQ
jgi:hypothetical protein